MNKKEVISLYYVTIMLLSLVFLVAAPVHFVSASTRKSDLEVLLENQEKLLSQLTRRLVRMETTIKLQHQELVKAGVIYDDLIYDRARNHVVE